MDIVFGLDNDADAATTFKTNFPAATFLQADVTIAGKPNTEASRSTTVSPDTFLRMGTVPTVFATNDPEAPTTATQEKG